MAFKQGEVRGLFCKEIHRKLFIVTTQGNADPPPFFCVIGAYQSNKNNKI